MLLVAMAEPLSQLGVCAAPNAAPAQPAERDHAAIYLIIKALVLRYCLRLTIKHLSRKLFLKKYYRHRFSP